jgi:hypothetical protein
MAATAKHIQLLLNDGSLDGVISVTDSGWYNGELYSAPREKIDELLENDACNRYGVYLLLSKNKVYVGQSTNLRQRIEQHILGKDWWERAILLTQSQDGFDRSDIDFLESKLISKAFECGTLDCENKNKGQKPKVSKFSEVDLNQYLDEALLLLELLGVTVFKTGQKKKNKEIALIPTIPSNNSEKIELRAKSEAIQYLSEKGINLYENVTYAKYDKAKKAFWMNPTVKIVHQDWTIVLNNQFTKTITILNVPQNTFAVSEKITAGKLVVRPDMPYRIDLKLKDVVYLDKKTNCDFSPFVTQRISY